MLKTLLLVCIVIVYCNVGFAQNHWVLKKDANNIKIYTRPSKNIPFDEYKATTTINTRINTILNELLEAPEYYENCLPEVSYLVKSNNNQYVFYAHKPLPWPIKDRDIITLLTVDKISDKKIKLTLESAPNEIPEKHKTIRIKTLMGHWLLEEKDNKTMVTQQLFLDPEGSLPAFVVNSLLIKGPYNTFKELHKLREKSS